MAEVGVLGATGVAGSAAARELLARGHRVVALGRRPGPEGTAHRPADVVTGEGLAAAFAGLDAVVECLNGPTASAKAAHPVLVTGVAAALAAAAEAGVAHVVSLSIVGCDHVPTAYYGVKVEQEAVVSCAAIPTTIVRATQFHGLVDFLFAATRRLGIVPAPRGVLQPVDPRDVAGALAGAVERGAGPPMAIAGPEVLAIGELARTWRTARDSRRPVVPVPALGRALRAVAAGGLTDPAAPRGARTWADYLNSSAGSSG
ncbi:MAG: NAD-dependent epimerase/dehydratase [Solirubrobacterales bacterium]|nr:NAD-dependent epimerase/dehydratase [Solirubrobacterales bacterium]